ncbi:hypothetical protein GIY30_16350 [Gordonia sp. HNM0687]|uniref:Uncharacterized protein n=1 Tax=Gordonia mangrovi TaxID=2665643 RepID=A0A6L7GTU9_9ACTN|nr:hypothetical protein [Gordonia mangrovi]MXP22912.1 hypothetical protein [Gordonia mangrovi]UVF77213.1 hypothetical protein NWF22_18160 [Gordonia mangrovi]
MSALSTFANRDELIVGAFAQDLSEVAERGRATLDEEVAATAHPYSITPSSLSHS